MLVADLRALNAKLDAHAFLRSAEVCAAQRGRTRTGHGRHDNSYDDVVEYTIHTNNDYSVTTFSYNNLKEFPFTCTSRRSTVEDFFQNTQSPINADVREYPKFQGEKQVGTYLNLYLQPYTLVFEKNNQSPGSS
jgi:hypothetical protein